MTEYLTEGDLRHFLELGNRPSTPSLVARDQVAVLNMLSDRGSRFHDLIYLAMRRGIILPAEIALTYIGLSRTVIKELLRDFPEGPESDPASQPINYLRTKLTRYLRMNLSTRNRTVREAYETLNAAADEEHEEEGPTTQIPTTQIPIQVTSARSSDIDIKEAEGKEEKGKDEQSKEEQVVSPFIKQNCFEGEYDDEITGDFLQDNSTVIFIIEGQKHAHCYEASAWRTTILNETAKEACIWYPKIRSDGFVSWNDENKRAWLRVLKVPRAFVYVQTVPALLLRFNTFYFKKIGNHSYSTSPGVSALHAINEPLFMAFPISRSSVGQNIVINLEPGGYVFEPTSNDVRGSRLNNNTLVLLEANGSFTEINKITGKVYAHFDPFSPL